MLKKLFRQLKLASLTTTIICIIIVSLSLFFNSQVSASEDSFVTIVNPVRGKEFWGLSEQTPLTAVKIQSKIIKENGLVATWLLRYDALEDKELIDYLRTLKNDELGLFLEITPSLTQDSDVSYHQGELWHWANSIFLSGYQTWEREKMIETAFNHFKEIFGFYPSSVGAWHVDSHSVSFMKKKYGITAVLICADQFSTDDYQIWGGWWSTPYYPSRLNILAPAQSQKNKLDVLVFQWAARDPVNAYGAGGYDSSFSVQANDYLKHGLDTSYFEKLLKIYTISGPNKFAQLTIGLENDYSLKEFGGEFEKQIKTLARRVNEQKLKVVLMKDFAFWYRKNFQISPPHLIETEDSLGSGKKATWLMTTQARLGFLTQNGKTILRDLRIYNDNLPEANYQTPNIHHNLSLVNPSEIDSVWFPEQAKVVDNIKELMTNLSRLKLKIPFTPPSVALLFFGFLVFLFFGFLSLKNRWLAILVFWGALTQSLTMVKSGLLSPFGMGFWGPNGHDGVWHIALINQLAKFSFENPVFAGVNLTNYHFLYDLFLAFVHRLTTISVITLYFQIIPVILSISLGVLTYLVVKKWTQKELPALFSVFFVYFGGSFGWIVTLIREKALGGESLFWANQSISFLLNPSFALSIIILLLGFYFFLDYLEKPTLKLLLILSFLFGSLIQIKVYAGVIVLVGLAMTALWQRAKQNNLSILKLFGGTLAVGMVLFLPLNWKAASLLVISPLWFPRTMLAFADRLGWVKLENARQAYFATGNWFRWILAEGLALVIFFAGNLGTRVIGLVKVKDWIKNRQKLAEFEILLVSILLTAFILPLIFVQKGNPWNTIQFFYYFLFISGIFAGIVMGQFLESLSKIRSIICILIILTLPTTIGTLKHYLPQIPPARISYEELFALDFLKKQPEGVVLTFPYNPKLREKFSEPKPLYAYETTAYVSAFSDKPTFLEDEMNLEIMGYKWQLRREEEVRFFATDNKTWAKEFLAKHKIRYIYLVRGQNMNLGETDIGAKKIFENGEVRIYQILW
ncbi:MAG: hypothetical protein ACOZBZ_01885 [Patescibacteria group bacterium]